MKPIRNVPIGRELLSSFCPSPCEPNRIEWNWVVLGCTGFYRVLPSFTEFYRVLPSFFRAQVYQGTVAVYTSAVYRVDETTVAGSWRLPVGNERGAAGLQLRGDILIR